MIVRLHYASGAIEETPLTNGIHFADYNGHTDVPGSQAAFSLGLQQIRYFKVEPKRSDPIDTLELIKGQDATAPIVMNITVEPK